MRRGACMQFALCGSIRWKRPSIKKLAILVKYTSTIETEKKNEAKNSATFKRCEYLLSLFLKRRYYGYVSSGKMQRSHEQTCE